MKRSLIITVMGQLRRGMLYCSAARRAAKAPHHGALQVRKNFPPPVTDRLLITAVFGCLLFVGTLSGKEAVVKEASVNVPSQMKDFVTGRLEELKKIAPHIREELELKKEDVNLFQTRIKEAEDNIAGDNWVKAFYAVTDSKLRYFIEEVLYKENRIRRSVLWAGPFPENGSAELENDCLNRRLENTPYPAPRVRGLGWQHLEFGTFLGSADEIPLKTFVPKLKGKAVVYLTGFLWPDMPLDSNKKEYQEGTLSVSIKGARILKVWVGGEEVFKEENGVAVGKDQPTMINIKRKGGWWWLLMKVLVEPPVENLAIEYLDSAGKTIALEKARDDFGCSQLYSVSQWGKPARLALWAPKNFGKVSEKLAVIRSWFEHLETAYQAYIKEYGKLPVINPGADGTGAEKFQKCWKQCFPTADYSMTLTNAFTDTGRGRLLGAMFFDCEVNSGNQNFMGDSLRVVVNGPMPYETWSIYDPKNGDYSPGQIFFALKIQHQPFIGMNWVSWCSFLEKDAKKRDEISKTNRFSTYELLPAAAK